MYSFSTVVAGEHFVDELEPDEGYGQGFEGVGAHYLVAHVGRDDVGGRQAREHKGKDH